MIFVTVGTYHFEFKRLIKRIDEIAANIDEEVIAQIGSTKYLPKNMRYFTLLEEEKLLELIKKARIVVTHAGAGTLLNVLHFRKPLILVPRFKKFNEVIDDHQLELTEVFKNEKKAVVVYDINNLESALKKAKKISFNKNIKLVTFLKDYIKDMKK